MAKLKKKRPDPDLVKRETGLWVTVHIPREKVNEIAKNGYRYDGYDLLRDNVLVLLSGGEHPRRWMHLENRRKVPYTIEQQETLAAITRRWEF